jgi:hypothetical protein
MHDDKTSEEESRYLRYIFKDSVGERILPFASSTIANSHVAFCDLSLDYQAGNHREALESMTLHQPSECLIYGSRVCKWGILKMEKEAAGTNSRESIGVGTLGVCRSKQARI